MVTNTQTVGQRIAWLRQAHGITRQALGEPDHSADDIARIESGQSQPPERLLHLLASRLNCRLSFLKDGIPPDTQHHIETAFAVSEQVLMRSDAGSALHRYTELRANAPAILLGRRTQADIGAALSHEKSGNYAAAYSLLEQAEPSVEVRQRRWLTLQAAMIRCKRLAGKLNAAENTASAAMLQVERDAPDLLRIASIAIDSELLAVYADRGHYHKAEQLAADLAPQLAIIPPDVEFAAYRNLAYAAVRTHAPEAALEWVSKAYKVGSGYSLESSPRLIIDCIHLLQAIPQADARADALTQFRREVTARGLSPDSSARRFVRQVRSLVEVGMIDEALEDCDTLLGQTIGASPKVGREVIAAYGEVLAAVGFQGHEATAALYEAANLVQDQPFLRAKGIDQPPLERLVTAARTGHWVHPIVYQNFTSPGPISQATVSYSPPQEPPTAGEGRRA